jgi:small basic protein
MTEPKPLPVSSKGLVICHILWAIALTLPFVMVMLFPDQMVDNLFDWLLFELPEIHNTVTTIEWIFVGAINILMILAVMSVFLIFRVIAIPVMIVTCLPSIIGSIGELMNKKWGMKVLLVSGIFSLVLIPFGTALGVWTIVRYGRRNKQLARELVEESQPV